jgi:transcription antitermination factor NusG
MTTAPRGDRWYALQLRTRWENSTATLLSSKGYEIFLPTFRTFKTLKHGHGRPVAVEGPLFPGYLFCRFDACNRLPVLVTPGVIAVVGRGRIPIPVEDSEIGAIQKAVSAGSRVEPCPYPDVGQLVRIEEGALTGVEGILTRFKGTHRIILSVSLLRRSVAVEIDRSAVGPIQLAQTAEERDVTDAADPRTNRQLTQPNHGILSVV